MAAIGTLYKNIVDMTQQLHRGKVLPDVELLHQEVGLTGLMPVMQCNDGTTHLYRLETALPTVFQTAHGEGALPSKSQGALERASCTMLQGWSVIPRTTSLLGGQQAALRAKEDAKFAESMRQKYATTILYDNRNTNLKGIYGIQPMFNRLSTAKSKNVIDCGGTGANAQTSAYVLNVGPDVYTIVPEGLPGGYRRINHGEMVDTLSNGNQIAMLKTEHEWHFGFVNEAWPSIVRLCNIEVADLDTLVNEQAPTGFQHLLHKLIAAKMRVRRRPGTPIILVNDTVYQLILRLATVTAGDVVTWEKGTTQFGNFEEMSIYGMRVVRCDSILNTESVVTNAT
jgi:major capsid protein gp7